MKTIFPIVAETVQKYEGRAQCMVCERSVRDLSDLFEISLGAIYSEDGGENGGPDDRNYAYASFGRRLKGTYKWVRILDRVPGGQVVLYFCSRDCLSHFLNNVFESMSAEFDNK